MEEEEAFFDSEVQLQLKTSNADEDQYFPSGIDDVSLGGSQASTSVKMFLFCSYFFTLKVYKITIHHRVGTLYFEFNKFKQVSETRDM